MLDDTVTGSYTKVVYVRFSGPGIDSTRTYTDDIIFDNTTPTIQQVTVTDQQRTSQSFAARSLAAKAKSRVTVKCKARDKVSGMKSIQVSTKKSARTASMKVYRAKVEVSLHAKVKKRVFVRVSDKAGNWTKWKKVKVRKR